jgi:hypothetical protein
MLPALENTFCLPRKSFWVVVQPILVEIDEKLYYFEGVIHPPLCSLAQNKCNKDQNWSEKSKILCGATIWVCMIVHKNQGILTEPVSMRESGGSPQGREKKI